jgi:hypothetical protein
MLKAIGTATLARFVMIVTLIHLLNHKLPGKASVVIVTNKASNRK